MFQESGSCLLQLLHTEEQLLHLQGSSPLVASSRAACSSCWQIPILYTLSDESFEEDSLSDELPPQAASASVIAAVSDTAKIFLAFIITYLHLCSFRTNFFRFGFTALNFSGLNFNGLKLCRDIDYSVFLYFSQGMLQKATKILAFPVHYPTKQNRRPGTDRRCHNPRSNNGCRIHASVLAPVGDHRHRDQLQ